jgi:hypothetical protein
MNFFRLADESPNTVSIGESKLIKGGHLLRSYSTPINKG